MQSTSKEGCRQDDNRIPFKSRSERLATASNDSRPRADAAKVLRRRDELYLVLDARNGQRVYESAPGPIATTK